jgi:hypothetical protein
VRLRRCRSLPPSQTSKRIILVRWCIPPWLAIFTEAIFWSLSSGERVNCDAVANKLGACLDLRERLKLNKLVWKLVHSLKHSHCPKISSAGNRHKKWKLMSLLFIEII